MSQVSSLNFPLTIVLQIFSYLDVDELIELYETCTFFRVLLNQSKLTPFYRTVGYKDYSKLVWLIEQDTPKKGFSNRNMGSEVIKYINVVKKLNQDIAQTEETKRNELNLQQDDQTENPQSPTLSNVSRSSGNSLFSDDEWSASLDESLPTSILKEEPHLHNIEKIRSPLRVKEKALLFEKLMNAELEPHPTPTSKQVEPNDALYDKYNELQNMILPQSTNKKNIATTYLNKIQEVQRKDTYIPRNQKQSTPIVKHSISDIYQQHVETVNNSQGNNVNTRNRDILPKRNRIDIRDLYEKKINAQGM